jgi:hypothetical protein
MGAMIGGGRMQATGTRRLGTCLLVGGRLLRGGALLAGIVVAAWSVITGLDRLGTLSVRDGLAHFGLYPVGAAVIAAIGMLLGAIVVGIGEDLVARGAVTSDDTVRRPGLDRGRGRLPRAGRERRTIGEVSFTLLLVVVALAVNGALIATFSGVVREHCLDVNAFKRSGTVKVHSHWTFILWPPLMFAANDPPGHCVRNNPARVALDYVGIWSLPSPEAQVQKHAATELFKLRFRSEGG